MFSDTHFHFHHIVEEQGLEFGKEILSSMADSDCFFGMDIGTRAEDLFPRVDAISKVLELFDESSAEEKNRLEKIKSFIYLSAGIWPDPESIKNRFEAVKVLEKNINDFRNSKNIFADKIVAIGEGGLDHHWNVNSADQRDMADFGGDMLKNEMELFALQLELAEKLKLPFVIHSRDAFEDTINCIKDVGYDNGILHCCSYGLEEVKQFVERGWYVSFSGSVTYAKKALMEQMKDLIRYVPEDRILLETDSPYLAPVPMRGKKNNPVFVKHTYDFVAETRGISVEELCNTVDKNCVKLFGL